jgi:hypothetical protein
MTTLPRALRTDLRDDALGNSQFIETRTIRPTSGWNGASQGQIRFVLPRQGIMDKNAFVNFQIQGATVNSRLPLYAGAWSMIDTATLYCGGVQVAQTRGASHMTTMKQFYRTPHNRNTKQSIRVGCFSGQMVDGTLVAAALPGHWGVNTYEGWAYAATPTGAGGLPALTDDREITTGYRLTNNPATTPEWRILLVDLFDILLNNNLPLGLINDEFSIVLDLTPDLVRGQRSIVTAANAWTAGTNIINPSLQLDLIFYDDPIDQPTTMDMLRETLNKGEQIVFVDHQYVLQNQPAVLAAQEQEVNVLLGLDHQVIRNILMATPYNETYGAPATSGDTLLGSYFSVGSAIQNTLQVSINSIPVFPNPLNTDGKIFDQLCQVFPTPFKINSAASSFVGQVNAAGAIVAAQNRFTDKTLFGVGHPQTTLCGRGHYYGVNLSRTYANVIGAGTAVGRSSVLLTLTDNRAATDLSAKLVHIWVACERLLSIKNGRLRVSGS